MWENGKGNRKGNGDREREKETGIGDREETDLLPCVIGWHTGGAGVFGMRLPEIVHPGRHSGPTSAEEMRASPCAAGWPPLIAIGASKWPSQGIGPVQIRGRS